MTKTKRVYTFLLLLSFLLFESFHVFSHMIHIKGEIQINITHSLSYLINIALLYTFYQYTRHFPNILFIIYLIILVIIDIYSIHNYNVVVYIFTQALLFTSLFIYYYNLFPKFIQRSIIYVIIIIIFIIILFINEKFNCKKMMNTYPHFPYHILIEIMGIILFYIISSNFSKL